MLNAERCALKPTVVINGEKRLQSGMICTPVPDSSVGSLQDNNDINDAAIKKSIRFMNVGLSGCYYFFAGINIGPAKQGNFRVLMMPSFT